MSLTDEQKQSVADSIASLLQAEFSISDADELEFKTSLISRFAISLGSAAISNLQRGVSALAYEAGYTDDMDESVEMDMALHGLISEVDKKVCSYEKSAAMREAADQKEQELQNFSTIAE